LVKSQVRFNRVPEKVPEKVWEALVQRQVRFNRFRKRFRNPEKVLEKVWEALVQSQVRYAGHQHGKNDIVFLPTDDLHTYLIFPGGAKNRSADRACNLIYLLV
jgi:hypothetical protein